MEPAGRDPGRAFGAPRSGTSDALFPEEVQSFPDNFSARLRHGSVDNAGGSDLGMISADRPARIDRQRAGWAPPNNRIFGLHAGARAVAR
jgi:hypothetical protein